MNSQLGRTPENASRIRSAVIIGASILLVLGACFFFYPRGPYYAGRSVNAWFHDLRSGVFGGTSAAEGFEPAYEAFTKMDSNAVPYLVAQLKYDRSGFIEKMLLLSRRVPIVAHICKGIVFPTEHRSYAAVALCRMGPKAESAVPALLETWVHDNASVKGNALVALHSILFNEVVNGYSPSEQKKLEAKVATEAARRFPKESAKLGIKAQ